MAKITITTTIDAEQHKLCQENKWRWSDLIKDGIGSRMKPDAIKERLDALEAEVEAQRRKIRTQQKLLPSRFAQ